MVKKKFEFLVEGKHVSEFKDDLKYFKQQLNSYYGSEMFISIKEIEVVENKEVDND